MIKKTPIIILIFVCIIFAGFYIFYNKNYQIKNLDYFNIPEKEKEEVVPEKKVINYQSITILTDNPGEELTEKFGGDNVGTILKLNRINSRFLKKGDIVVVPNNFDNFQDLSPFPAKINSAENIAGLILFSQEIQAFGVYENGNLLRWGPISSGKESTKTKNGLFFTNWKSKEIASTVNEEWILKWTFNLDNFDGISMHQYELPGYPASHSCVRLFGADAKWLYYWAKQWKVSESGTEVLAYGTPVIIFGEFDFQGISPWQKLVADPKGNDLKEEYLNEIIKTHLNEIMQKTQKPS